MDFLIIEAVYDTRDQVNSNNELTADCKVLIGNIIYDYIYMTNMINEEITLTDLEMERITTKDRFLGVFNDMDAFKSSELFINCYVVIGDIVYLCEPNKGLLIKQSPCFTLEEGSTTEDGIAKAIADKVNFFLLENKLHIYDRLNKSLKVLEVVEQDKDYIDKKYVVLDNKTWEYIIHHLTRNSIDYLDLKTFRDENVLIDNTSYSTDRILSSEFIAAYIAGIPKENLVLHNIQEIQRLLNIQAKDLPMTAKNGGIIVNTDKVNISPKQKVFSSQILNSKFEDILVSESEDFAPIATDKTFITSFNNINDKLGNADKFKQYNDNKKISIIDMINSRFNQIGNLNRLKAVNNESCVSILNEMNNYIIKIGTIIWYAGLEIPKGWMLCDGSTVLVADYPELYAAIGNKYCLPTDTFDDTVQFRIPTGTARTIVGFDEANENFNQLGKRGGMNEVAIDRDYLCSRQHAYKNYVCRKADYMEPTDLDKEFAVDQLWTHTWLPTANERSHFLDSNGYAVSYEGYKYLRLFDSINNIAKVNHNGFRALRSTTNYNFNTTGQIAADLKLGHYNIQPYITLRMIIKIDEEI